MKKSLALILALFLALSLCACGTLSRSVKAQDSPSASGAYTRSNGTAAYSVAEEALIDGDYYDSAYSVVGLSASAAAWAESDADEGDLPDENPEKIIYSSNVTVETTEFDETIAKVDELVKEYGGWVESSSINGSNYYDTSRGNTRTRSASYSLRIPSDRFSQLMNSLSVLGNIPYSYIYTENVTTRYYDTQARLTAYTAQEARLLEMMDLAESIEDVIAIEDKLTDLRYEIESLQSSLNNWDRRVSYSTVSLSINEVREYTPEPEVRYTFGDRLWDALLDGLDGAGEFLLLLVTMLPALLILAVIVLIVVLLVRRAITRRRAKKAAKPVAKTEEK